jgi:rhamnosyltransferase
MKNNAIIIHLYYFDLWKEILNYISKYDFDVYITIPKHNIENINIIRQSYPDVTIMYVENKGRDILPFLKLIDKYDFSKYKFVLKIHTKKSPHTNIGNSWRIGLYRSLINNNVINNIIENLDDNVGIIGPSMYFNKTYLKHKYVYGNKEKYYTLCNYYNIDKKYADDIEFFAGTMFWISSKIINKFKEYNIPNNLFAEETGKHDGETHHAFERVFIPFVKQQNMNILKV